MEALYGYVSAVICGPMYEFELSTIDRFELSKTLYKLLKAFLANYLPPRQLAEECTKQLLGEWNRTSST